MVSVILPFPIRNNTGSLFAVPGLVIEPLLQRVTGVLVTAYLKGWLLKFTKNFPNSSMLAPEVLQEHPQGCEPDVAGFWGTSASIGQPPQPFLDHVPAETVAAQPLRIDSLFVLEETYVKRDSVLIRLEGVFAAALLGRYIFSQERVDVPGDDDGLFVSLLHNPPRARCCRNHARSAPTRYRP